MPLELVGIYLKLPLLALVAARLAGVVMFLPVLGGLAIPARVRALLVIGLAALVTPLVPQPAVPPDAAALARGLAGELLLGALIGLALRVCFLGVELGATLIAQESGLAFGAIADPSSGLEESVLTVFYAQLAAVIFLLIGGQRAVLRAALDSFAALPPLAAAAFERGVELVLDALALSGAVAVRVAAPVVITLFLTNVAMGFVSRTVPQLNVITIGFSIKGLLTFLLIAAALPAAVETFADAAGRTLGWIGEWLL